VAVGVDLDGLQGIGLLARQRVELGDRFDLVAEQREAPGPVLVVGGEELDGIAPHPKGAAHEVLVVAPVVDLHQALEELVAVDGLAHLQRQHHLRIGLERADAVDARDRGNDDHVVALQERPGGGVAHAVDLLVDVGVFLDIGIGARHVGLGLVVVVIGDEILDRVVGKEALHLAVELSGEGLVGGEDQAWAAAAFDDLGHGEGLARAGDS
jgi:hypothetical protein